VAPTKPLVSQQIDACHKTCGIPGHDAAELTGEITRANRAKLVSLFLYISILVSKCGMLEQWQEKRIFYMTPQTLVNDLATGICDPLDVILIVVGSLPSPSIHR
jgi:ATP-dependent DNA helicase MPH1